MHRYSNLDYLRGLAAFSILQYHFNSAVHGPYFADTIFGRLGIYGVSIFYVLSGLTLFLVYSKTMAPSKKDVADFAIKRFFRIFPLLWLALALTIILKKEIPDFKGLFLNASGLFGFLKPTAYFGTGMWSIGNELVFYVAFPLLIYFRNQRTYLFVLSALCLFSIYLWFSFFKLSPFQSLEDQWATYVNPMNQIYLFVSGIVLGMVFSNVKVHAILIALLMISAILCFLFFPVSGDLINLVTGANRIIFSIVIFIVCFGFFKANYQLSGLAHSIFSLLGEISYSVYLLHPIVWKVIELVLKRAGITVNAYLQISIATIVTLILSYLVYQYFERYFIRLGKSVGVKLKLKDKPLVIAQSIRA